MKVCFTFLGPLKYRGRLFKQIKTLKNNGFEVMLIHGQTEKEAPDYSIYDFPIIPVKVVQESFKMLTFLSQLRFGQIAAKLIETNQADIVVSVALQSALSGALSKSRNPGRFFIFDNNELSIEMISSKFKRKVWSQIHNYILKKADVVMHAEKRRLEYFSKTYRTEAKQFLLENLPFFKNHVPERGLRKSIRCVYVGGFMPGRFIEEILIGFSELNEKSVFLDMIGFYSPPNYEIKIRKLIANIDTSHIKFLPPVSHSKMYNTLSSYDIGLAFYSNTNLNNYYCAPNKIYDYIQMGIPVITNDYPGLIDVIQKNRLGVCVSSVDTMNFKNAIHTINSDNLYANIDEKIKRRYSWENQEREYLKLFYRSQKINSVGGGLRWSPKTGQCAKLWVTP